MRYVHKKITIIGSLSQKEINIKVEDDGVDLDPEISLKLNDLLANKQFGLAGMHERASLMRAEMNIVSKPNIGTQIQVIWKADKSQTSHF